MKQKGVIRVVGMSCFALFLIASLVYGFEPGKQVADNFFSFSLTMLKIVPCAFILVGLFEVWVKRETVEKHFGVKAGIKGFVGAVLLAGTMVGGLYVAFPLAYSLYHKGAKLSIIFTYLGATAICRIPMGIFEASFLGIKFTLIRLVVSLPLVIISSIALEDYMVKRGYTIMEGK